MKRSYDEVSSNHPSTSSGSIDDLQQSSDRMRSTSKAPSISGVVGVGQASGGALVATTPTTDHPLIPKISRKIRACTECKKQKVKCDMPPGQSTCTRCARQKLECVVNRSLQTILDDDLEWKSRLSDDTAVLQRAVNDLLFRFSMPPLSSYAIGDSLQNEDGTQTSPIVQAHLARIKTGSITESPRSGTMQSQPTTPNGTMNVDQMLSYAHPNMTHNSPITSRPSPIAAAHQHYMTKRHLPTPGKSHPSGVSIARVASQDVGEDLDDETGPATTAMGSLYEVTKLRNLRSNGNRRPSRPERRVMSDDFVSKGIIDLGEAEELFQTFNRSLNHYLWGGIALIHSDLTSVRQSSSILSSAIFTVAALHLPEKCQLFDLCYEEFLSIVSASMFDRYQSLDDIRGFCIGAFWLSEISWRLSSHAIRVATELNLHQAFGKAISGSEEHFIKARLWYLLYICDKHFSIAYGRPPVICENDTIKNHESFLKSPMAQACDYRLISQVALFIILNRMYDTFGPDMDAELSPDLYPQIRQFNIDLDTWKLTFQHRLPPNEFIATYPAKGVTLHYYFAKLQLNCLSLRGVTRECVHNISTERKEIANNAIDAAVQTLTTVLDEPDIRNSLVGVPIYIHTMIAFAAVFLMKIATKWKAASFNNIDPSAVWSLVEHIIAVFQQTNCSERHLIWFIGTGLTKMLAKCREWEHHKGVMEDSSLWDALLRAGGVTPEGLRASFIVDPATPNPGMVGYGTTDEGALAYATNSYVDAAGLGGVGGVSSAIGQNPAMNTGGAGMYYDQTYFPMGIYDFLTTQMPG